MDISLVIFRPRWEELEGTLGSLAQCRDEFRKVRILISGADGERARLDEAVATVGLDGEIQIRHRLDNVGFASGHNLLLAEAFDDGAEYALIINPDVRLSEGAITALFDASGTVPRCALVGPGLRSAVDDELVDSMGIEWTVAGRHRDRAQGRRAVSPTGEVRSREGLTGACLLVSREVFMNIKRGSGHFFDDYFLAYREDAELGVRAGALGIPSVLVDVGGFSHGRAVKGFERGNSLADRLGVRNRFLNRWKLGDLRPGMPGLPTLRDLLVIFACLTVERQSLPALLEALRIRRAVVNRGRRFRCTAKDANGLAGQ